MLWAGWNTEELTSAQVDGPVTWSLDSVDGPGDVTVFQTGVFGDADILFRSADGLPDARSIALGTHAHGNWAFGRPGAYRLTFTMSARLRSGETVRDTQTLPVTVGAARRRPRPPDAHARPEPEPTATPAPEPRAPGRSTPDRVGPCAAAPFRAAERPHAAPAPSAGPQEPRRRDAAPRQAHVGPRQGSYRCRRHADPAPAPEPAPGGRPPHASVSPRAPTGAPHAHADAACAQSLTLRSPHENRSYRHRRPVAGAAHAHAAVTLRSGHADFGARIVGGKLQSQVKDATSRSGKVAWRDPSDVVVAVGSRARYKLPNRSNVRFLGKAGTRIWLIPQTQRSGVIWLGWNTESLSSRQVRGGVAWTLERVSGPGRVVVFQTGSFGAADVLFDSSRSAARHAQRGARRPRARQLGVLARGHVQAALPDERDLARGPQPVRRVDADRPGRLSVRVALLAAVLALGRLRRRRRALGHGRPAPGGHDDEPAARPGRAGRRRPGPRREPRARRRGPARLRADAARRARRRLRRRRLQQLHAARAAQHHQDARRQPARRRAERLARRGRGQVRGRDHPAGRERRTWTRSGSGCGRAATARGHGADRVQRRPALGGRRLRAGRRSTAT